MDGMETAPEGGAELEAAGAEGETAEAAAAENLAMVDVEQDGADLFELPARTVRMAYAGLAPDDVRRQPYPRNVFEKEFAAVWNAQRWARNGVDVLALRLQYGRGVNVAEIADQFGYSRKSLWQRVSDGMWSRKLSDANRIDLSRRVWLAGLARLGHLLMKHPEETVSAGALERLREASNWQDAPKDQVMWTPLDDTAHDPAPRQPVSQHELERRALLDDPANPDRTYRDRVTANLERLLARLDRQQREKAAAAAESAGVNEDAAEKAP